MSYIEMPSSKVKELAEACLARIEESREKLLQEHIDKYRKHRGWFERLPWSDALRNYLFPVLTDEQVGKQLMREDWVLSLTVHAHCYYQKQVAERLLKAIEYTDCGVHVAVKDLDMIV